MAMVTSTTSSRTSKPTAQETPTPASSPIWRSRAIGRTYAPRHDDSHRARSALPLPPRRPGRRSSGASSGLGERFARVLDAVGARRRSWPRRCRPARGSWPPTSPMPSSCRSTSPSPDGPRERLAAAVASTPAAASTSLGEQRRDRPQGVAGGRSRSTTFRAHDGDQRHRDLAPPASCSATPSWRTAAAASSTSRRCSATSARRRSSRPATAPARVPSST